MVKKLYLDTYALVEIGKNNPRYVPYTTNVHLLLNKLNLMEFAYYLVKIGEEKKGKELFDAFSRFHVEYDDEILLKAAEMKLASLKQRLSFVDCIGYMLAKKNGAKFLTGDEQFRHKENVEFVK